jgi:uncharacterized membrane protein YgdD (TMEM256/DUF423 family)
MLRIAVLLGAFGVLHSLKSCGHLYASSAIQQDLQLYTFIHKHAVMQIFYYCKFLIRGMIFDFTFEQYSCSININL